MQGQTLTWQQEPEGLHHCTGLPIWATPSLQMSCEHIPACSQKPIRLRAAPCSTCSARMHHPDVEPPVPTFK